MPVIFHSVDDVSAVMAIADSNLEHREKLPLSEKARRTA
jgi:hypothetical protein